MNTGQKATKAEKEEAKLENKEFETVMKFLSKVNLFKRLPISDHPMLAGSMSHKYHKEGDEIIKQGSDGDEFFVIFKGTATVLVVPDHDDNAPAATVANLKAGDYFGEAALLRADPRNATIKATGALETLSVTREKFQELGLHEKLQFAKRQAVLAAAMDDDEEEQEKITTKNEEEKKLIASALKANENLNALVAMDDKRVDALVEGAWKQEVASGTVLIEEGDPFADHFYIVQQGSYDISVSEHAQTHGANVDQQARLSVTAHEQVGGGETMKVVSSAKKGDSFGELALLYYAPRAATVKATSDSVVWVINRALFKAVLLKASESKIKDYVKILDQVSILDGLLSDEKLSIAEALVEMHFNQDEIILKEGEMGSTFFILYDGQVSVIKGESDKADTLKADAASGETKFFGERALLKNEPRAATVQVSSKTAKALALDRESFELLLGPLEDILKEGSGGATRKSFAKEKRKSFFPAPKVEEKQKIKRDDLRQLGLLGCGGFGMVTLQEHVPTKRTFALKALSKGYVVKTGMQASVMNEKTIQSMCDSVFVVRLYETYRGAQNLYFLLEPALGGELYATYHRRAFHGREKHAQFYCTSVICAFEHLHERRVIYRDLKPENVLLDKDGYAKLTDMGLAKFVIGRTYTTCGTPDYFAPEVIASTGHNRAVDWWALGILIFELMTGHPPFESSDPMQTYMKVMQGIEKVRFPRATRGPIEDLVKNLLKREPSERLPMRSGGANNLRTHKWLESFDWKGLAAQTIEPPYKPKVKSETDMANFSAREEDAPRQIKYIDDGSGWDDDF